MWSMGHIKKWYLQYKKAGDQYLGRVVCGLDVNNASLAMSPPFFNTDKATIQKTHLLFKKYTVQGDQVTAGMQ